jgi:hypothetical protein
MRFEALGEDPPCAIVMTKKEKGQQTLRTTHFDADTPLERLGTGDTRNAEATALPRRKSFIHRPT